MVPVITHPVNAQSAAKNVPASPVASLRQRLKFTQPEFARLLGVSVRTLVTLESGAAPKEAVSRRLSELTRLVRSLSEVIAAEALGGWLKTPNAAFDGLKPVEVLDRGEIDRLWLIIYELRSGQAG